ncbi:periplasmic chaperone for outer membrane proteins Skp [Rhodobacter aestuarii]|uniref:Periplasmic chaperone for outer membrane proteins Skp n=1 Tax=Rhodobacter aestuarii TaxID=453582 RepID=A0A1N7M3Q6_9RHOB|nr:OmpH family outer membrane protein [Rhodobacter aestuarii]PTV94817.1 periplasmic chaperone for outer membrane proteins Skp [Rhodobacter aestuarii]SIS80571.1 periplasmic chaperone for outer membrane proteins Skp [Rhodobacter aestuarii]
MRGICPHIFARPGGLPGLLRASLLGVALLLPIAVPVSAQDGAGAHAPLPVLTMDVEGLFERTLWGKRIMSELAAESAALTAENNRIADDLIAEEKSLTDRRASLAPGAFRAEADAFDERATGIRNAQRAKSQALSQSFENQRQAFYTTVAPLMDEFLASRGAVVLLDRRAIIRGLEAADITDELVDMVNARMGDGLTQSLPDTPAPLGDLPAPMPQPPSLPDTTRPSGN